jgi:hypothetical protein
MPDMNPNAERIINLSVLNAINPVCAGKSNLE